MKLIKIIKEARPLIPVVAVSSGYFHTELNDYFRISDATVNKPIDEYKIRELLFELKKEFFDASSIAKTIEDSIKKLDISSSRSSEISEIELARSSIVIRNAFSLSYWFNDSLLLRGSAEISDIELLFATSSRDVDFDFINARLGYLIKPHQK